MHAFLRLTPDAALPVTERPTPERLISGDPVFTTWNVEERDGLYCGIWQSTPGKWRMPCCEASRVFRRSTQARLMTPRRRPQPRSFNPARTAAGTA